LAPSVYDFYLYGHGNHADENSVFNVSVGSISYGYKATINGPDWLDSPWVEGEQYVEFDGVEVGPGQNVTITAEPGGTFYAVISGLQIAYVATPTATSPVRDTNGNITLNFTGYANSSARVWATADLTPPVLWESIFTNENTGPTGSWQFVDTNAPSFSSRFYRFSIP
jgi:hypothetical protein